MESDGKDKLIKKLKARMEQLAMLGPSNACLKSLISSRISNPRHPKQTSRATTSTGSRRSPVIKTHQRTTRRGGHLRSRVRALP
jgi:hypothetical protein